MWKLVLLCMDWVFVHCYFYGPFLVLCSLILILIFLLYFYFPCYVLFFRFSMR
jgi:hypothetical protein